MNFNRVSWAWLMVAEKGDSIVTQMKPKDVSGTISNFNKKHPNVNITFTQCSAWVVPTARCIDPIKVIVVTITGRDS